VTAFACIAYLALPVRKAIARQSACVMMTGMSPAIRGAVVSRECAVGSFLPAPDDATLTLTPILALSFDTDSDPGDIDLPLQFAALWCPENALMWLQWLSIESTSS